MDRDRIKRAAHWKLAKEALSHAANYEMMRNSASDAKLRESFSRAADMFRTIAADELRKIPAPFIAMGVE